MWPGILTVSSFATTRGAPSTNHSSVCASIESINKAVLIIVYLYSLSAIRSFSDEQELRVSVPHTCCMAMKTVAKRL